MDPAMLSKTILCTTAIVGAVVLAALGRVTGAEALGAVQTVLVAGVAGVTVAGAMSKWAATKAPTLERLAAALVEPAPPTPKTGTKL